MAGAATSACVSCKPTRPRRATLIISDPAAIPNPFRQLTSGSPSIATYTDLSAEPELALDVDRRSRRRAALGGERDGASRLRRRRAAHESESGRAERHGRAIRISIRTAQPWRTVSFEWYPARGSIVRARLFYTRTSSPFITGSSRSRSSSTCQSATSPILQCTAGRVRTCSTARSRINRRTNGGGGTHRQGFELQLTQPIWGGFGVHGQLHVHSMPKRTTVIRCPATRGTCSTCRAYFENQRLSARLVLDVPVRVLRDVRSDPDTLNQEAPVAQLDASVGRST